MYYMPPEALKEKASCTPKLDIFSFGHLALYTANQEFPEVYDVTDSLTMKMKEEGTIQRERRKTSITIESEKVTVFTLSSPSVSLITPTRDLSQET